VQSIEESSLAVQLSRIFIIPFLFNFPSLSHHIVVAHPSSMSIINWFLSFLPWITEVLSLCYTLPFFLLSYVSAISFASWFFQLMLLKACLPAASNLTMPRQCPRESIWTCATDQWHVSQWDELTLFNCVAGSPLLWFYILSHVFQAALSIVLLLLRGCLLCQQDLTSCWFLFFSCFSALSEATICSHCFPFWLLSSSFQFLSCLAQF